MYSFYWRLCEYILRDNVFVVFYINYINTFKATMHYCKFFL